MDIEPVKNRIFRLSFATDGVGLAASESEFELLALEVFRFQYESNRIYREYINTLGIDVSGITKVENIPFLPIAFFKTHEVICYSSIQHSTSNIQHSNIEFQSSTTTTGIPSRHFVKDISVYKTSFRKGFAGFYGDIKEYCILALLPSYLERTNSSLVYMANELIKDSHNPDSGFYMSNYSDLVDKIRLNEERGKKTLLLGVTYALLKLAEEHPMKLKHTIIMETGGMKGRREELIRQEVHKILLDAIEVESIHSEYGMTELLSQAYSKGNGIFRCVPWMRVLVRDVYDPFKVGLLNEAGALNIIDLANINSCSFIATDDLGVVSPNEEFQVIGRLDSSDIRGCNIMSL